MDMVKLKRIKSKSPYLEQEIRNIGALLEHTDDRVTAIAEQYGEIKKTLDQHTSILDHHTDILDQHISILDHHTDILDQHTSILDHHTDILDQHTSILDHHTDILDQHTSILDHHTDILDQHTSILDHHTDILDQHTSNFDSHEGMIGGIATDLKIVKEDVSSIKNSLKKKVDIDDFTPIVRRLTHLEKQVR